MYQVKKVAKYIIALILIYILIVGIHHLRYDRENYNCSHMTRDCEVFFETVLGMHCLVGHGYNSGERCGHQWLVIDFKGFWLEWESTGLYFKDISNGYEIVRYDEGYIL